MWADTSNYPNKPGSLFLGHDGEKELGLMTERHAITIAGAGAGKGTCVIIPNLLRWRSSVLVIDPKGEAAEATAQARKDVGKVFVLDPFESANVDAEFKASYNPLDELDPQSLTIREDIEAVADGIVMRADPQAAHWDEGAQSIISGLIAYILVEAPRERRSLILMQQILSDDKMLSEALHQMSTMDACGGLCREAFNAADAKEGEYFVSNARKNTRWLASQGMANVLRSSSFKLAELKTGVASVFLVLPANYLGQHGRFLRLFVRCGIEAMSRKIDGGGLRGTQCLFFLDEFFSLGYIDEIAKASGLMRGYGLQLWPILQDLGQLVTLYGREGSETFFGNADLHQFFGNTDKFTLEYMSAMTGATTIEEVGAAPDAPINAPTPSILGGVMSQSSDKSIRGMGAVWGGVSGALSQLSAAADQADYQNKMNEYQQRMATVGRPRVQIEEMAQLVQRKNDVVADNMFCITHGADRLLVKPLPYFRELVTPAEAKKRGLATQKASGGNRPLAALFAFISGFAALLALVGILTSIEGTATGNPLGAIIVCSVVSYLCYRGWKKFRPPKV